MVTWKKFLLSPRKILAVSALGFGQCIVYLLPYLQNVFYKPMMDSLGISNEQLGFILTVYGWVEIASFLPGGFLADKFDSKKLVIFSMITTGLICIICAFDMSYQLYLAIWVILSVIGSMVFWSANMKSVRLSGTEEEQGKLYGYFYFFNNGLYTVIGLVTVAILAHYSSEQIGLKYIILFYAVMNFISALFYWFALSSSDAASSDTKEERATYREMLQVLKYKETWFFAVMAFTCYSVYNIVYYFTPYFTDVMGLSVASAGLITVLTGPFAALISPLAGTLCDYVGSTLKTVFAALVIVAIFFCVALIYTGTLSLAVAIGIDALITVSATAAYTVMFAGIEETGWDRKLAGTCIGVASIIGYAPDAFMYTLFGHWLDAYGNDGYAKIFLYSIVVTIVGIIACFLLYRSAKKSRREAQIATAAIN